MPTFRLFQGCCKNFTDSATLEHTAGSYPEPLEEDEENERSLKKPFHIFVRGQFEDEELMAI